MITINRTIIRFNDSLMIMIGEEYDERVVEER